MFFHPMSSSVVACRKEPAGTGPVQAVAKGPTASLKQPERPSGASRSKPQVHTEQQSAQALFAPPEKPPAPMHTAQQSAQQPPAPPSKPPPPAHTVQQSVQVLHGPPAVHARSDSHGRSCMHGPVVGPSPVAGTPGRCPQAAASAQLQPQPGAAAGAGVKVCAQVPSGPANMEHVLQRGSSRKAARAAPDAGPPSAAAPCMVAPTATALSAAASPTAVPAAAPTSAGPILTEAAHSLVDALAEVACEDPRSRATQDATVPSIPPMPPTAVSPIVQQKQPAASTLNVQNQVAPALPNSCLLYTSPSPRD